MYLHTRYHPRHWETAVKHEDTVLFSWSFGSNFKLIYTKALVTKYHISQNITKTQYYICFSIMVYNYITIIYSLKNSAWKADLLEKDDTYLES